MDYNKFYRANLAYDTPIDPPGGGTPELPEDERPYPLPPPPPPPPARH